MDNANTKEYLDKIRSQVVENLKRTAFAPSVQMTDVPRDPLVPGMDDEADAILDDLDEDENKDKRFTKRRFDQYIEKVGELSDSEDEAENAANGVRRQPGVQKRRNRQNYRNVDVADSGPDSVLATPKDASSMHDDEMDLTADTKTGEVNTEEQPSPMPAEPTSRAEETPVREANGTATEREAPSTSAPATGPVSPAAQDEDTTMEDAGAPAPEPEQTEASINGPQGKTPPQSPPETAPTAPEQPRSPVESGSLAPGGPQSAEATESAAEAPKEEETVVKAEEPAQAEESSGKPEESKRTEE